MLPTNPNFVNRSHHGKYSVSKTTKYRSTTNTNFLSWRHKLWIIRISITQFPSRNLRNFSFTLSWVRKDQLVILRPWHYRLPFWKYSLWTWAGILHFSAAGFIRISTQVLVNLQYPEIFQRRILPVSHRLIILDLIVMLLYSRMAFH